MHNWYNKHLHNWYEQNKSHSSIYGLVWPETSIGFKSTFLTQCKLLILGLLHTPC